MNDLMGEDEYGDEEYGEEEELPSTAVKGGKLKVPEAEYDFMWWTRY